MTKSRCKICKKPLPNGSVCEACKQKTIDKTKQFMGGVAVLTFVVQKAKKVMPKIIKLVKK